MCSSSFSSQSTLYEIVYALSNPARSFRLTSDIANMVLLLKERKSVKPDHLIRDPVRTKEVSHGFSYKQNDLEQSCQEWESEKTKSEYHGRKDICQGACQLEHDHDHGHRDSHYSTKKSV